MNILYTVNNAFVSKVAASVCSLFENNRNVDQLIIYILTDKISLKNKDKFRQMELEYGREIVIIEFGDIKKQILFDFDTLGWNSIVMSRILWDRFLPEEVNRIIYLDGDTIINGNLTDLWNTDLNNCILGGCIEATVDYKRRKELGMENIPYINSGVLLIDRNAWRINKAEQRILDFYKENDGRLFAPDQDAINGALKGEIYYLEPKYNFYNIYWFYPYKFLKKLMKGTTYYSLNTYQDSLDHPTIIHYLGEERPWRKGNHHKFRKLYVKYSKKTPWKNEPQEDGWELYFKCWGIFNIITKGIPSIRYKIINGLIPLFMKWRKLILNRNK